MGILGGMRRILALVWLVALCCAGRAWGVERWGCYEIVLHGPGDGNPFVDTQVSATFSCGDVSLDASGFYDGDGVYRVRFMPGILGKWNYVTHSNRKELDGQTGEFECDEPGAGDHGPVRVAGTYHFAYADGTPFVPMGTTCYGWIHQSDQMQEKTVATLKGSPFNKVRMSIFPTDGKYLKEHPEVCPFVLGADGKWDHTRFNCEFFRNLEKRLGEMRDEGVEADLILFVPYGGKETGFDRMPAADDDRYVSYVVARLSAYRNVWWSMANEFDLIKDKTDADWDRMFQLVQREDPAGHLRSIHFSQRMYDYSKPWVTHLSVQNGIAVADFGRAVWYRDVCRKPVVFDEVFYEGDIDRRWGQLSGEEMTLRFWLGTIAGTYVGHGETFKGDTPPAWTSAGGTLRGTSPARIGFLKSILDAGPREGIEPIDRFYETHIGGKAGEYYLVYFGQEKPSEWRFELPKEKLADGMQFHVDVLDTWDMTVTPVAGTFTVKKKSAYLFGVEGDVRIALPGKSYMALRIVRVGAATREDDGGGD
jgi:hypothetical protein